MWTMLGENLGVTGKAPNARSGHGMTTVGQDIYIFGGYSSGEA